MSYWSEYPSYLIDVDLGYGFHGPPRLSIAAKTTKLQSGPAAQAVEILNKYGHATPPLWDAAMDTALTDAVSNILKNGANPLNALKAAADKCTTELQTLLS